MPRHSYVSPADIDRMATLRQNGMCNQAIAHEMGLSKATVYRYLGRQPLMCRAEWASQSAKVTDVKPVTQPDPVSVVANASGRVSSLKVVANTQILDGTYFQFKVSSYGNVNIRVKNPDKAMNLDEKGMEAFITELLDAYSALCAVNQHIAG